METDLRKDHPIISIILPTYNERQNLPIIAFLIKKYLNEADISFEIIVVDDSSPDGTARVAKKIQECGFLGTHKLLLHSRPGKLGLGSAYKDGMRFARGDYIVLMDADLSHHPKYIPKFLAKQKATHSDIVTGTRYACGSEAGVCGWDLKRKIISRGANTLTQLVLRPGVSDLTGSFRLYKRESLYRLLNLCSSNGFVFQMEVIVNAKRLQMSVEEVPIIFVDRMYGQSKMGSNEILQFLSALYHLSFCTY